MPVHVNRLNLGKRIARVRMGIGDVVVCITTETHGTDRSYVLMQQCEPGAVGECKAIGRELPFKPNYRPGTQGACVTLEFDTRKSVQTAIDVLQEHMETKFGVEEGGA